MDAILSLYYRVSIIGVSLEAQTIIPPLIPFENPPFTPHPLRHCWGRITEGHCLTTDLTLLKFAQHEALKRCLFY